MLCKKIAIILLSAYLWKEKRDQDIQSAEDIPEMNYDCSPSDEDEHQNYDGMGREACSA